MTSTAGQADARADGSGQPAGEARVETAGRLDHAELDAVTWLVEAATTVDGVRPLSEHVSLALRHGDGGGGGVRNVLVWAPHEQGGALAGYAYLDGTDRGEASAELVVHPDHRRRGYGRLLVQTLLAEAPGGQLRLWAHGRLLAAEHLARAMGFEQVRELRQLRRPLYPALPAPRLPGGVTVRTFRPGADEDAWVALNGRAFAHHPEQGSWTRHDLALRMEEPWFDPAGFFLAERAGVLVGFHWTKVHAPAPGPGSLGEVYVVGVDPAEQGSGLGRALTLVGLAHLRERGLATVMLYVDADNPAALHIYTALGFTTWHVDLMYRRGTRR